MKEELAKAAWKEASAREGTYPGNLSRHEEEAGLSFCYIRQGFIRIFSLYVAAWGSSWTSK
jgi:hypothetical protein